MCWLGPGRQQLDPARKSPRALRCTEILLNLREFDVNGTATALICRVRPERGLATSQRVVVAMPPSRVNLSATLSRRVGTADNSGDAPMIWWEQRTIINKIKEQTQSANSTHRDRESSDSPRFTHTYQHFNVISSPAVARGRRR